MLRYIAKRLIQMIPVMLIISILIFAIIVMTPGEPIGAKMDPRATPAMKEAERERLGLNKPIYVRYGIWISNMLKLDFGESSLYNKPVKDIIGPFIKNSLKLNLIVFLFTYMIAIPIGIFAAVHKDGVVDKVVTVTSYLGASFPTFFIGLILIFIFSIKLDKTPISGMITAGSHYTGIAAFKDVLKHMILPAMTLVIVSLPRYIRYVRMNMLNAINQDYIRTARAKGLSEKVVIFSHAFRNSLVSIVTLLGFEIPMLFSGAAILESVFNWPGIGRVMLDAITNRDYNLMMATLILIALLTLIGNLLADVCYAVVDPRVKVE